MTASPNAPSRASDEPGPVDPGTSVRLRLVASSALMLFLELALIRWTGSNVVHLAYFSNFVLMGSFLGIGAGFLRAGRTTTPPYYSLVILALLVTLVLRFPVAIDRSGKDLIYFTSLSVSGPPAWLALPVIFLATAVIMMGPAELVGQCFKRLPRLESYRLDLVGSLIGIAAFTALSFRYAPPVAWGVLVAVLYVVLLAPRRLITGVVVVLPALTLVFMLGRESLVPHTFWSPYSKIHTNTVTANGHTNTDISANGVPHQGVTDAAWRLQVQPFYGNPYLRTPANPHRNVLIVGAGSGTDAAIALTKGVQHVDAVEIDPRLHGIGDTMNPNHPYQDPRVSSHINDGRAYLSSTGRKYDLIIFALPDSLTLVPGQGALRLESYLFTQEAFQSAREHLRPGGAFAMYNFYRERWLVDRLAGTAARVFHHRPCLDVPDNGGSLAVMTVGLTSADQSCGETWTPRYAVAPSTDDRPFVYLRTASIPNIHLVALGLILLTSLIVVRAAGGSLRRMRNYADLFLLGAAFMLLETKNVTGFALLFGTTWMVNAIVFAGVLLAVLAAVEVTRRFRTPPLPVMFGVLFAGLAVGWLVPAEWLLGLSVPIRLAAAVTMAFLPIFAANVIFAKRFAATEDATTSFGANLLGAMLGACLEYAGLVVGYRALLLIAAALYAGALILMRRSNWAQAG